MNILITGPQGSGKGTQAQKIEKKYGYKHISIGDLLRDEAKNNTPRARIIKEAMEKGELIPEKMNNEIIERLLENHKDGLLLDGYPRNLRQAQFLLSKSHVDLVLDIHIDDEESLRRMSARRICTANHKIFVDGKITSKDIEDCERLGGKIIHRADDKPEAIKKRLKIYHERTEPLMKYFKEKNIRVEKIDGEQPIEKVFSDIQKILGRK